ncbi:MAG: response regulator [Deltaproteobacteria bacterium]|nr:response regulator [Deltaproteobacteria bacterium]
MKILIVEDDYISRNVLQKTLELAGYDTITAEDGLEALEIYLNNDINLVISDWMMPNMDGVSLCKKIRETSKGSYVYFIILTVKDTKEDIIEALEAGADDFISKPFNSGEIKARIKTGERIIRLEQQHRMLQAVLLESKNKLLTVFDSLKEEVVSIDPDFKIISANKSMLNELNMPFNRIIGSDLLNILATRNFTGKDESIPSLIQKTFETGKCRSSLHECTDSKGELKQKELIYTPVKNNGKTIQVVISCRDLTEEMKNAEKIAHLNKELNEAILQVKSKNEELEKTLKRLKDTQAQILQSEKMSSIGQLAAGVAHEINNPTGFVSSNLKTLSGYQDDLNGLITKYREFLSRLTALYSNKETYADIFKMTQEIIEYEDEIDIEYILGDIKNLIDESQEGARRIRKIVLDLKDFAHPGEDKLQLADINKNIESTLNIVWNEIKYKATVTKELGKIPEIECYQHQLNQVFMNILVNAAQAIDKKGEIKVITKRSNNHIDVVISDNGSGIAEENLSRIFDPFFTTKEAGKGTGLGLNVAYNIIQKHKGKIGVESKPGMGTTFTVSIPIEINEC